MHLAAFRGELVLVLDEDDGRLGRVDGAAALRLGRPEHAVAALAHVHSGLRLRNVSSCLKDSVVLNPKI